MNRLRCSCIALDTVPAAPGCVPCLARLATDAVAGPRPGFSGHKKGRWCYRRRCFHHAVAAVAGHDQAFQVASASAMAVAHGPAGIDARRSRCSGRDARRRQVQAHHAVVVKTDRSGWWSWAYMATAFT